MATVTQRHGYLPGSHNGFGHDDSTINIGVRVLLLYLLLLLLYGGAHWRHLANTTELSVCCINVALGEITLTTCLNTYYEASLINHRHLCFNSHFPRQPGSAGSSASFQNLWDKWHRLSWAGYPSRNPINGVKGLKEIQSTDLDQAFSPRA